MDLIAHSVKNLEEVQKAASLGCNLFEVDVSQNIITSKFLVQHNGPKGKIGIGKNLNKLLESPFVDKLVLDVKHAKYSINYLRKINKFLKSAPIKNLKITGIELKIISQIALENNTGVYYGFLNSASISYFQKHASLLYKPAGFSIKSTLIEKNLIKSLKNSYPDSQIWAWTVNNKSEMEMLEKLGVDAVVTDTWKTAQK